MVLRWRNKKRRSAAQSKRFKRKKAASASQQVPSPPSCPLGFVYTMQAGESLFRVARRFNITIDDLLGANPQITNPDLVFIGQSVCIPFIDPQCASGIILEIAEGDTLFTIADQFGVSESEIRELNPQITNPTNLIPGQRICLPEGAQLS